MEKLYGREIADDHPARARLTEMQGDGAGGRAVACNLRYDARVSEERAAASGLNWLTPDGFKESHTAYYEREIRRADLPDFLNEHNWRNVVYGKPGEDPGLHGGLQLVRLINISGLHVMYSGARQNGWVDSDGRRPFSTYPADEPDPFSFVVVEWVRRRMESEARRTSLINSTLRYMTQRLSAGSRFHPAWVTALDDFPRLMQGNGNSRWPEMLGLGHWMTADTWWFGVCYPVETATNVAIPTVLDSGLSPFFFPTPPDTDCGYAADLAPVGPSPVREWIHAQCPLDYYEHHWPVNRLFSRTIPRAVELEKSRDWHWVWLQSKYGTMRVQAWMPEPL